MNLHAHPIRLVEVQDMARARGAKRSSQRASGCHSKGISTKVLNTASAPLDLAENIFADPQPPSQAVVGWGRLVEFGGCGFQQLWLKLAPDLNLGATNPAPLRNGGTI